MTQRKPPNLSFPDWVAHQIRTAEAEGAFENLEGAGKPIPDLDRPRDELAWVASYLRRENVDVAPLLPPGLALAKEVELLPDQLARERSEARVRATVEDLNRRIREALLAPQVGPAVRVRRVDVEAAVEQWRAARAAIDAARGPAAPTVSASPAPARRRWWFGRRAGG